MKPMGRKALIDRATDMADAYDDAARHVYGRHVDPDTIMPETYSGTADVIRQLLKELDR